MADARRWQFSLSDLLMVMIVLTILVGLSVQVYVRARRQSLRNDCRNNLKQLGNYLTLYASSMCYPRPYPCTSPPGGSGAPIPAGPNGAFWAWLYRVPNGTNAVSLRPGDDSLYVCRVTGTMATSSALEYTCPVFDATWPAGQGTGPIYPAGRLFRGGRGDAPVGGDLIGPVATPNHGGEPRAPNDNWNMLCFDGHVEIVAPNSAQHILYATATVGVRTT
ncbi:MAG: hypothetical protein HZA54_19090 [Planctomycetes bacterium]|nr:hypothetical protein [Planctomycetota bacterium]